MSRTGMAIRKWTMLIHRWMGVVFCVLFLTWFVSGIVMMYQFSEAPPPITTLTVFVTISYIPNDA